MPRSDKVRAAMAPEDTDAMQTMLKNKLETGISFGLAKDEEGN